LCVRLKNELRILNAREAAVKEKEMLVTETQASFDRLVAAKAHGHLIEKDRVIFTTLLLNLYALIVVCYAFMLLSRCYDFFNEFSVIAICEVFLHSHLIAVI